MSRIRSIHPGLWTDEAFVSLSPMARLMLLGIWNECDDMGSFAWSPLTLKMRILPGDNADAAALLAEMIEVRAIMKYEVGGKAYGAVRNFCQYQRPKKPNSTCPQTDEVRNWVNTEARSTRDGSEAVPNQLPTDGEKPRQMDDEGDKGKASEANASGAKPPDPLKDLIDLGVSILTDAGSTEKQARSLIGKWRKEHGEEKVLASLLACKTRAIASPVEWITKSLSGLSGYVSASGFQYRGSEEEILRKAESRADWDTYWSIKKKAAVHAQA
jgi:hypothetical protein